MEVVRVYQILLIAEIRTEQLMKPIACGFCFTNQGGIPDTGDRILSGEITQEGQRLEACFVDWVADTPYLFRSFIQLQDSTIYGDLLTCTFQRLDYGVRFESKIGSLSHPSVLTQEQRNFKKNQQILHTQNPEVIPGKDIEISYKLDLLGNKKPVDQGLVIGNKPFPTVQKHDLLVNHWESGQPYRLALYPDQLLYYRAYFTADTETHYGIMYQVKLTMDEEQPIVHSVSYNTTTETPTMGQPDPDKIVEFANRIRAKGGYCKKTYYPPAPALKWSEALASLALDYSTQMNRQNRISHQLTGVPSLRERALQGNYDFLYIGENLARGEFFSEKTVIEGWFESADHCTNLMNAQFKEMGVARSGNYWTQLLGTVTTK